MNLEARETNYQEEEEEEGKNGLINNQNTQVFLGTSPPQIRPHCKRTTSDPTWTSALPKKPSGNYLIKSTFEGRDFLQSRQCHQLLVWMPPMSRTPRQGFLAARQKLPHQKRTFSRPSTLSFCPPLCFLSFPSVALSNTNFNYKKRHSFAIEQKYPHVMLSVALLDYF